MSVLIYIAEKREELEPEKRHANRGRNSAPKRSNFSLLVAEYEVTSREKGGGPFLLHLKWDKWHCFMRKKRGNNFFSIKAQLFSLFIQQNSEAFLPLPTLLFFFLSPPPLLPFEAPKFLHIYTPNRKEKPFSES